MKFIYNDGGRAAAGYKGSAGDCVTRAVAIATGLPYQEVYEALANGTGSQRASKRSKTKGRTARNGIHVRRKWFKDYMAALGFLWVPTMGIGTGCKVHLHEGELPMGRLVVSVSKHYTCVIDGNVEDTFDPRRDAHWCKTYDGQPLKPGHWLVGGSVANGVQVQTECWVERRCVYGYWHKPEIVS